MSVLVVKERMQTFADLPQTVRNHLLITTSPLENPTLLCRLSERCSSTKKGGFYATFLAWDYSTLGRKFQVIGLFSLREYEFTNLEYTNRRVMGYAWI